MRDLFVYGTLTFPEVLGAVLGRAPSTTPAAAEGWRAAALCDRVFPGLVPAAGRRVEGLLVTGLRPREWRLLDAFEAPFYEQRLLTLVDGRRAWAYVCTPEAPVGQADWDRDAFAAHQLAAYLARCAAWRCGMGLGEHS